MKKLIKTLESLKVLPVMKEMMLTLLVIPSTPTVVDKVCYLSLFNCTIPYNVLLNGLRVKLFDLTIRCVIIA